MASCDLAALRRRRLGGVLDQVEEHLDQQVAIAVHRRQRRIVFLDEADMAREARSAPRSRTRSSTSWMLTGPRSIGRRSENTSMRSTSAQMRSVSSQMRRVSSRSAGAGVLLEQLRRAADAGERVLHLVRQHRGHRRHRARGVAMGELAVDLVGDRALLQRHHDAVAVLGERRRLDGHDRAAEPRRVERRRHIRRRCARCGAPMSIEREERAVGRQELGERQAAAASRRWCRRTARRRRWRSAAGRARSTTSTGSGSAASTASRFDRDLGAASAGWRGRAPPWLRPPPPSSGA